MVVNTLKRQVVLISGIFIFDVFVLVLLLYGLVSGIFRGFFKEIGSIVGLILAFIITFNFGDNFAALLKKQSLLAPYAEYVNVIAYVVLFLLVILVVNLGVSFLLFFVFKMRAVKIFNRIGGAVAGVVKGFIVCAIIYFLLVTFMSALPHVTNYVVNSKTGPYFNRTAQKMQVIVGDVLKNQAFHNLLYPEVPKVPPPPSPMPQTGGPDQSVPVNEAPMYIPPDNDELLHIESFE